MATNATILPSGDTAGASFSPSTSVRRWNSTLRVGRRAAAAGAGASAARRVLQLDPRIADVSQTPMAILLDPPSQKIAGPSPAFSTEALVQSGSLSRIAAKDVRDRLAREPRLPPGQHLVEHAAERPDVGALVDRRPAPARGSCRPRARMTPDRRGAAGIVGDWTDRASTVDADVQRLGQAEIQHLDIPSAGTLIFAGFRSR